LIARRVAQAFDKNLRGFRAPTTKGTVQNQLGVALDRDEAIGITHAIVMGVLRAFVSRHYPRRGREWKYFRGG
jgi:hypothetical protein